MKELGTFVLCAVAVWMWSEMRAWRKLALEAMDEVRRQNRERKDLRRALEGTDEIWKLPHGDARWN